MVYRRAGNYRLGVWDRYAGTATEEGILHAGGETGPKRFDLASSSLAEGAVRFGHCLLVNGGPTLASCLDSLGNLIIPSMRLSWSMTDRPMIRLISPRSSRGCATFIKAIKD